MPFVDKLGNGPFDQVLVNWYQNGNDYISAHSDDEPQIKPNSQSSTYQWERSAYSVTKHKTKSCTISQQTMAQ